MSRLGPGDWGFLEQPPFAVFASSVRARLSALSHFPSAAELSALAQESTGAQPFWFDFAPQVQSELEAAGGFDRLIAQSARIPTRADSYHDLLGALVWLHFAESKTALHRIQLARAPLRGAPENAATHLDESGVLILSSDSAVFQALAGLRWSELFWEHRAALRVSTRFWAFGHGLLDSLRAPHPKLMAKALCVKLAPRALTLPDAELRPFVDRAIAAKLSNFLLEPARLYPLPVLGVPGWASGQCSAFYENREYFRTQRRRVSAPRPVEWLDLESP